MSSLPLFEGAEALAGPCRSASAPTPRPSTAARDRLRLQELPHGVLIGQLSVIALLGGLHAAITWAPAGTYHPLIVRLVDMDAEANLPMWFSASQWLLLAMTLAAIAVIAHASGQGRCKTLPWTLCAGVALYLSVDEAALLHERFGTILEEWLERAPAGSPARALFDLDLTSYYWTVAYLPFLVPLAIGGAIFLWRELGAARRCALLGMFLFLYAAVGLDWIEGRYGTAAHTGIVLEIASRRIDFDILVVEETLELLGVTLALHACLRHLSALASRSLAAAPPDTGASRSA